MTHQQLAPVSLGRTPAASRGGVPKAKIYQTGSSSSCAPTAVAATPRTGLSLLSNDNTNSLVFPNAQPAAAAPTIAKPVQAALEPERGPPPAFTYETPFEWEFLPDTVDWLRLLRRFGGSGSGGYGGFGQVAGQCGDLLNNKENVPPVAAGAEKPLSPATESESPKVGYWEESPTQPRRSRDDDCVDICFDIDRIL